MQVDIQKSPHKFPCQGCGHDGADVMALTIWNKPAGRQQNGSTFHLCNGCLAAIAATVGFHVDEVRERERKERERLRMNEILQGCVGCGYEAYCPDSPEDCRINRMRRGHI